MQHISLYFSSCNIYLKMLQELCCICKYSYACDEETRRIIIGHMPSHLATAKQGT